MTTRADKHGQLGAIPILEAVQEKTSQQWSPGALLAAIAAAAPKASRSREVVVFALMDAAGCSSLPAWEDAPGRHHGEVVAAVSEALWKARAGTLRRYW